MATEDQHDENKVPPSLNDRGVARRRLVKMGAGVLLTLEARAALASPVCATPSGYLSGGLHNSHYGPKTCDGGLSPDKWAEKERTWPGGLDRKKLAFTTVFPMNGTCQTTLVRATNGSTGQNNGNNGNHYGNGNGNGNNGNGNNGNNGNGNGNGNNGNGNGNGNNGNGNNGNNGNHYGNSPQPGTMVPVPSYQCALLEEVLTAQSYDANSLGMYMAATYLNIRAGYVTFLTAERLQEIWIEVSTTGVYKPIAGRTWSREELKDYFKATMIL